MFENWTRRARKDDARLPDWLHTVALLAAVLAGLLAFPLVTKAEPAVGTEAPDFALKSTSGQNLRLSEYRGELVVVTFWATWCGECRQTLAALDRVGETPPAVVLGVNLDADAARAAAVARSAGFRHPTLVDTRSRVGRLYALDRLPLTLLVDRDGIVRGSWSRDEIPGAELEAMIKELAGS
jgi:peroxiredoxin